MASQLLGSKLQDLCPFDVISGIGFWLDNSEMIVYLETLEEMIPGNSIVFRGFQCLIGSCYFPALKLKAASTIQVLKNTSYTVCCFLTTHGCGKNSRGFLCVYQIQHYGCLQSAHLLANAICLKLVWP